MKLCAGCHCKRCHLLTYNVYEKWCGHNNPSPSTVRWRRQGVVIVAIQITVSFLFCRCAMGHVRSEESNSNLVDSGTTNWPTEPRRAKRINLNWLLYLCLELFSVVSIMLWLWRLFYLFRTHKSQWTILRTLNRLHHIKRHVHTFNFMLRYSFFFLYLICANPHTSTHAYTHTQSHTFISCVSISLFCADSFDSVFHSEYRQIRISDLRRFMKLEWINTCTNFTEIYSVTAESLSLLLLLLLTTMRFTPFADFTCAEIIEHKHKHTPNHQRWVDMRWRLTRDASARIASIWMIEISQVIETRHHRKSCVND